MLQLNLMCIATAIYHNCKLHRIPWIHSDGAVRQLIPPNSSIFHLPTIQSLLNSHYRLYDRRRTTSVSIRSHPGGEPIQQELSAYFEICERHAWPLSLLSTQATPHLLSTQQSGSGVFTLCAFGVNATHQARHTPQVSSSSLIFLQ